MKNRIPSAAAILLVIVSAAVIAGAQVYSVTGRVTDAAHVPIRDASVTIQPFARTTFTDIDGYFTLDTGSLSVGNRGAAISPTGTVRFSGNRVILDMSETSPVTIQVYGVNGRVIGGQRLDNVLPGHHSVNPFGIAGANLGDGAYIIRVGLRNRWYSERMINAGRNGQGNTFSAGRIGGTHAASGAAGKGLSSSAFVSVTISKEEYVTKVVPLDAHSLVTDIGTVILIKDSIDYIESQYRVYKPLSLEPGEKIRGYYRYAFSQFPDIHVMREFAERSGFVLGPVLNEDYVAETTSLAELGDSLGHPELATAPVVYYLHSAGAYGWWGATNEAIMHKTLAIIGHHSLMSHVISAEAADFAWWGEIPEPPTLTIRPEVLVRDTQTVKAPVWNLQGELDNHPTLHPLNLTASAMVSEMGWPWTFTMGFGESHGSNDEEALKLQTLWLEEVADLRIQQGTDTLKNIDATKCWVGYIEIYQPTWFTGVIYPWEITGIEIYSHADAPGSGVVDFAETGKYGGYVWLPSEEFANAWKAYHLTGRVDGDTAAGIRTAWWTTLEDLAVMPLGLSVSGDQFPLSMITPARLATWETVETPPEFSVSTNGILATRNLDEGVFKIRLRTTRGSDNWEGDWYFGLRGGYDDDILSLRIQQPADTIAVGMPLHVKWECARPAGLIQWYSSIDGAMGTEFNSQGIGLNGEIPIENLSEGDHLITMRFYSAAPVTRRKAVSFRITVTH